ncbi:MAG: Re/Si-specific NAD(P)(+) transhydrogenase subunit alpha [Bryobacteraceae bacterium]
MGLTIGVLKETFAGERRVAMVPRGMDPLVKAGAQLRIESGAGVEAGVPDKEYEAKGAIVGSAEEVRKNSQILFYVRVQDSRALSKGQVVIGMCDPLSDAPLIANLAQRGIMLFAMELIPRITRAQSMDVLSSMASIAGYKAALIAANTLPRLFPMMTTAAGTIPPARVLVIGAGVAGLQAIATARRLGAVVSGYDVRSAVKEQIESLGAKFVSIDVKAEGEGGYARALTDDEIHRQREQMAAVLRENDVVITTAAVPGRKAPILITAPMARGMTPGSVIVDIAAERGGNCELTRPGETVVDNGVNIMGPVNLASTVPFHASQLYARNLATFLKNMMTKDGQLNINMEDEIVRETLVARNGEVVHPKVRALVESLTGVHV